MRQLAKAATLAPGEVLVAEATTIAAGFNPTAATEIEDDAGDELYGVPSFSTNKPDGGYLDVDNGDDPSDAEFGFGEHLSDEPESKTAARPRGLQRTASRAERSQALLDRAAEQERTTAKAKITRVAAQPSTSAEPTGVAGTKGPLLTDVATDATMTRIQEQAQLLLGKEAGTFMLPGDAMGQTDLDPAAADELILIMEYYDKHAPGAKTEAELIPVAEKCAKYGYSWLNGALKQKYGQSMDEFRRRSSCKAMPTPENGTQEPMYVNDGETFGFSDLSVDADQPLYANAVVADNPAPANDEEEEGLYGETKLAVVNRPIENGGPANRAAGRAALNGPGEVHVAMTITELAAGAASDKPDLVGAFTTGLAAYYAKHAPGQSTAEELLRMAIRAAKKGTSWLDKPLKRKYGETYTQFVADEASPAGAADIAGEGSGEELAHIYGNDLVSAPGPSSLKATIVKGPSGFGITVNSPEDGSGGTFVQGAADGGATAAALTGAGLSTVDCLRIKSINGVDVHAADTQGCHEEMIKSRTLVLVFTRDPDGFAKLEPLVVAPRRSSSLPGRQSPSRSTEAATAGVSAGALEESLRRAELAVEQQQGGNDFVHPTQMVVDEGAEDEIPSWRQEQIKEKEAEAAACEAEMAQGNTRAATRLTKKQDAKERKRQASEQLLTEVENLPSEATSTDVAPAQKLQENHESASGGTAHDEEELYGAPSLAAPEAPQSFGSLKERAAALEVLGAITATPRSAPETFGSLKDRIKGMNEVKQEVRRTSAPTDMPPIMSVRGTVDLADNHAEDERPIYSNDEPVDGNGAAGGALEPDTHPIYGNDAAHVDGR